MIRHNVSVKKDAVPKHYLIGHIIPRVAVSVGPVPTTIVAALDVGGVLSEEGTVVLTLD